MRLVRIQRKPQPKGSNFQSSEFVIVGVLEGRDQINKQMMDLIAAKGSDRIVPITVSGNKKLTELIYDLTDYDCSLRVRTEVATFSFEEVIVTLFELFATYEEAFAKHSFPATHIFLDYDRVFISKKGTIAFMIDPTGDIRDNKTLNQLLIDFLINMRLTEADDRESVRRLMESLPKQPGDTLQRFIEIVTSTYNKIIQAVKNGEFDANVKEQESVVEKEVIREQTPMVFTEDTEDTEDELSNDGGLEDGKSVDDYLAEFDFEGDKTSFVSIKDEVDDFYADEDKTVAVSVNKPKPRRFVLERVETGETFDLEVGKEYKVGRSAKKADIILQHNTNLSGVHVTLVLMENNEVVLTDIGSTNGTFYVGTRLEVGRPVYLSIGDDFTLATEDFRVVEV